MAYLLTSMGYLNLAKIISKSLIITSSGLLAVTLLLPFIEVVINLFNSRNLKSSLILLPLSFSKHLNLPPGHPASKSQVYAGHPTQSKTYLPVANFHRFVFEHKFAELTKILTSLGAKKIEATLSTGWDNDFVINSELNTAAGGGSTDFSKSNKLNNKIVYKAELDNKVDPKLPDDIVWFHYENTWQELARQRLSHNLKKISVNLEYIDDFSINSNLKLKIKGVKLDMGGKFIKHTRTVWTFDVEFS